MIKGVGIDIIEMSRINKAVENRENFVERFFTRGERDYFESKRKGKTQSIAGYFAAKEAISKALGTGLSGFKWKDIEILKSIEGVPQVALKGKAKVIATELGISEIMISISHCKEYAVAQAIAIGK